MAKLSSINKNERRRKLVEKTAPKLEKLKAKANDESLDETERLIARLKMAELREALEREDFAEVPPKGFHRLSPGKEVRLRYGYIIRCESVIKDPATGEITEVRCTYDPATRGGSAPDGRKIPGTIHWVSAEHSVPVEVRVYDRALTATEVTAVFNAR